MSGNYYNLCGETLIYAKNIRFFISNNLFQVHFKTILGMLPLPLIFKQALRLPGKPKVFIDLLINDHYIEHRSFIFLNAFPIIKLKGALQCMIFC